MHSQKQRYPWQQHTDSTDERTRRFTAANKINTAPQPYNKTKSTPVPYNKVNNTPQPNDKNNATSRPNNKIDARPILKVTNNKSSVALATNGKTNDLLHWKLSNIQKCNGLVTIHNHKLVVFTNLTLNPQLCGKDKKGGESVT